MLELAVAFFLGCWFGTVTGLLALAWSTGRVARWLTEGGALACATGAQASSSAAAAPGLAQRSAGRVLGAPGHVERDLQGIALDVAAPLDGAAAGAAANDLAFRPASRCKTCEKARAALKRLLPGQVSRATGRKQS